MSTNSESLKSQIFVIDMYDDSINNFKDQLTSFGSYERKLLRNGRHKNIYEQL
jgi:hypothetical protein